MELHLAALRRIEVPGPGGRLIALGERVLDSIRGDDVEAVRAVWRAHKPGDKGGEVGANRLLARLRHMFNWAILRDLTDRTPFRKNGVNTIKLVRRAEAARTRRLGPGEEERLLAAANPKMRAILIAALETGCRIGELLSLQFKQINEERNVIILPAEKTKAGAARVVPMTALLRQVIASRRLDAAGQPFGPEDYVFGNSVGEPTKSFRTAWDNTRRRAGVTGLHIHDLRREAASRILESPGVALHDVASWMGHASVVTTAKYLATNATRQLETLRRFEDARNTRNAVEHGEA
jgi:integrase